MDIFTPFRLLRGHAGGLINYLFLFDRQRPAGEKHLFVDVTEIHRVNSHTGVPRVTSSVLKELYRLNLPYRIVEVYARPHHEGFFSVARRRPIRVARGDVFFGLDLSKFLTQKNRWFLDRMYRSGIPVYFYVHDLIPITFPENCSPNVVRAFPRWLATVSRYSGLIANSRSTRDEFADYFSRGEHRAANERLLIDFAYPGTDFASLAPGGAGLRDGQPGLQAGRRDGRIAFIAVGAIEKRKGYGQLLGAFELLRKKGVDLSLTIVGPAYERGGAVEQAIFSSSHYGTSLFWYDSYVSDEKLASLYAESDAYISASWAEGFGLPVIEAASYDKPLILRDITVFRELGGEGAFYFSGESAESLAAALEDWISLYRTSQVPLPSVRGRSWRSCAEDICRIILPEYRAAAAAEQEKRKAAKPACDVSVIIVNYNTCSLLRDCLASIYARTEGIAFEVLVSDNGSTDGSAEMVRKEFPQVELLENRANLGFGAANNRALDRAVGKYVFYLNSDTVLVNNAVKIFFDYWEAHAGDAISCLGCNLMWPDGQFCRSAGESRNGRFKSAADFRRNQRKLCFRSYRVAMRHYVFKRPLRLVEDQDPPVEKRVGPVGYVTGADLFLLNNGQARFDEGYFMYYEEVDLEYALSAAGKQPVLIDGPQIIHLEGASSVRNRYEIKDQTDFSKIQMSLSAIRFFKKHALISPGTLFLTKLYTALLWLNPLIFRSTRRYIRRLALL